MPTPAEKRTRFRALHESGCFVIPNPWDAGSAKMLQAMGFQALASTSSGMAWSGGRLDNEVPVADALAHLAMLSAAVDVPLNADFENGHGDAPQDVADNVRKALAAGVAGLSIEDMAGDRTIYDTTLAVERVRAAKGAAGDAVLVARAEGLLIGKMGLTATLDRLVQLADAGADCLYLPGLKTAGEIATVVKAVAPKPVNVLAMNLAIPLAQYADLGVRRVSVGGALARAAWAGFLAAAKDIAENGRFDRLAEAATSSELKALLKP
jgi:2-methylisocitrate lyase-like PEP mutase family enzyme